jgi:transposase
MAFIQCDRNSFAKQMPGTDHWLQTDHIARTIIYIISLMDLSDLKKSYAGCGSPAYDPAMMLGLFIYGYICNITSTRAIEQACTQDIGFIFIAGGSKPDHDTLATFRKRFFAHIVKVFAELLKIAKSKGILKNINHAAADGTKIYANASKNKNTMSWKYSETKLKFLCTERLLLLRLLDIINNNEYIDQDKLKTIKTELDLTEGHVLAIVSVHDCIHGDSDGKTINDLKLKIENELRIREAKIKWIKNIQNQIKKRVDARYAREMLIYNEKIKKRSEIEKAGGKPRGKIPVEPNPNPLDKDQVSLTDEDARIMPRQGGQNFIQGFNAQIAVELNTMLILCAYVTNATNDKLEIEKIIRILQDLPTELGEVKTIIADNGYFSEANVLICLQALIEPLLSPNRESHTKPVQNFLFPKNEVAPKNISNQRKQSKELSPVDKMKHDIKNTDRGRKLYALRKQTAEPTFGIIKTVMGFCKTCMRGLKNVTAEWQLVAMAYNFKRLHNLGLRAS